MEPGNDPKTQTKLGVGQALTVGSPDASSVGWGPGGVWGQDTNEI